MSLADKVQLCMRCKCTKCIAAMCLPLCNLARWVQSRHHFCTLYRVRWRAKSGKPALIRLAAAEVCACLVKQFVRRDPQQHGDNDNAVRSTNVSLAILMHKK